MTVVKQFIKIHVQEDYKYFITCDTYVYVLFLSVLFRAVKFGFCLSGLMK